MNFLKRFLNHLRVSAEQSRVVKCEVANLGLEEPEMSNHLFSALLKQAVDDAEMANYQGVKNFITKNYHTDKSDFNINARDLQYSDIKPTEEIKKFSKRFRMLYCRCDNQIINLIIEANIQ